MADIYTWNNGAANRHTSTPQLIAQYIFILQREMEMVGGT
jgi:hypothetical protein